jgi:hypothetical protein
MTLSSLIGSLTGRETAAPAEPPRRPTTNPASSPDVFALLQGSGLQFVPPRTEHSLGAQREVRERIAELLPGVTFDDEGHGAFTRTGYAVEFDTGSDDHVNAVRVHITGGVAAMPPLLRLAAKTGWRLESVA